MTNHPREDGLLEWVANELGAALARKEFGAQPVDRFEGAVRLHLLREFKEQIESRGPLLDVGAVRERLDERLSKQREMPDSAFNRGTRAMVLALRKDLDRCTQPRTLSTPEKTNSNETRPALQVEEGDGVAVEGDAGREDRFVERFFGLWADEPPEEVRAVWERDLRKAFRLSAIPLPHEVIDALPLAEREEYERKQQSIVDARRAAPANEGRNVISSTQQQLEQSTTGKEDCER